MFKMLLGRTPSGECHGLHALPIWPITVLNSAVEPKEGRGDGGRLALQARQRWASEPQRARLLNSKKQQLIAD